MTHAECQDLLLDLAYGELDAARAAEVQSHLAGCADCQRDQAEIAETRRMASPLRSVEEPSPRFDARILAAARAEANLRSQRRKPRWGLRVALGGSVAAAAALALVMSTTLQSKKAEQQTASYEIHVEAAAQKAQREAVAKAEPAMPKHAEPVAPPQPAPVLAEERRAPAEKKAKRPALPPARTDLAEGSGGDSAERLGLRGSVSQTAPSGASGAMQGAPHAAAVARLVAPPPAPVAAKGEAAGARDMMKKLAAASPASADEVNASSLEAQAQEARHIANYMLAASLYRRAAALRQRAADKEKDSGTAAWDLAHAVECLAAAGQFDEARQLRAELERIYPSESTPLMAAGRAVRSVDMLPAAAPAAEAAPASKPPSKAADDAQAH